MNQSPWSVYGRTPQMDSGNHASPEDPVAGVVSEVLRGRAQVEKYLDGLVREYYAIKSGDSGYGRIIADALTPSDRPETIAERFARLERHVQAEPRKRRSQDDQQR